jgi:uncharacterized phiE125 gp8 family phage protein
MMTYLHGLYESTLRASGVRLIADVTQEPITLAEAKLHLRVDSPNSGTLPHEDDSLIGADITAAREWCEMVSGLSLAPRTLEAVFNRFPTVPTTWIDPCCTERVVDYRFGEIVLPYPPVTSVTTFAYMDGDGVEQTVGATDYVLDNASWPHRIYKAASYTWPTTQVIPNAVRVRYLAGYSLTADESPQVQITLPKALRQAMLLMLTHLYENRGEVEATKFERLPVGAESLLRTRSINLGVV